MERYDLTSHVENMPFITFCDNGDPEAQKIVCGTPFLGLPKPDQLLDVTRVMLTLDTNVFNFIRERRNRNTVLQFREWAEANIGEINPAFAIAEQRISHGAPTRLLREYADILKQDYGRPITLENFNKFDLFADSMVPSIKENISLFSDYLVLLKHVYHLKGDFSSRFRKLCALVVENDLPYLTFMLLFSSVYLLARECPEKFEANFTKKVARDLGRVPKLEEAKKRLNNLARDVALFYSTVECFRNPEPAELTFSFIASSDITIGVLLNEIKCGLVIYNPEIRRSFGSYGFSPSGICMASVGSEVIRSLPVRQEQSYTASQYSKVRRVNLHKIANELLEGTL